VMNKGDIHTAGVSARFRATGKKGGTCLATSTPLLPQEAHLYN
jgi:hypothetical protein